MHQQLFVYGTLRKNGISHHLLKEADLVQEGVWLQGFEMYSAGWYPVAVSSAGKKIVGDIVAVPTMLWSALDAYEGDAYERVYIANEEFWLYQFTGSVKGMSKVEGGDWLSWWAENS